MICTYNRASLLDTCLKSILIDADEKPDEVVIVNGGSDDADRVVDAYRSKAGTKIHLIKTVNKNLATSRNIGFHACSGDIIALTDDDARIYPDWVTAMKQGHAEHPEAGAVGGLVVGIDSGSFVSKVGDLITFPAWTEGRYVNTLPGVNISFKKKAVQEVGFQDETLFRGEDVDFNWRVIQRGYKIYFDPRIRVYHYHRSTLRGFLYQHYMYGRAYYLVRSKWPLMYSVYPRGIRSFKDILKLINFFAALIYTPVLTAMKLARWGERILAVPLLALAGVAWKWGMCRQKLMTIGDRS